MLRLQQQLKNELHKELKIRYKEFFESKFAVNLLKQPEHFPVVNKVSLAILKIINAKNECVLHIIANDAKITNELRTPYFGGCFDTERTIHPKEVLDKIISILASDKLDLASIMQIHSIFIYRIYDHIDDREKKLNCLKNYFSSMDEAHKKTPRLETKKEAVKPTKQLGIARNSVFAKLVGVSETKHMRAMEKFQLTETKDVPAVCGLSGHTKSLMLGAKLYGDLTQEETKEYALAIFTFLTAGGHHSFHEVMEVANFIGVDFKSGSYISCLPSSLITSSLFKAMKQQFPEFLDFTATVDNYKNASSCTL